jgi:hypothetical protein
MRSSASASRMTEPTGLTTNVRSMNDPLSRGVESRQHCRRRCCRTGLSHWREPRLCTWVVIIATTPWGWTQRLGSTARSIILGTVYNLAPTPSCAEPPTRTPTLPNRNPTLHPNLWAHRGLRFPLAPACSLANPDLPCALGRPSSEPKSRSSPREWLRPMH